MRFSTLAAAAIGIVLSAGGLQAQPLNLTLSGGNPGGLWSLLGAGIDRAVKDDNKDSVITYQATGGGFANIALLAAHRTNLGLAHDAEIKLALLGDAPFKAPVKNLREIGYMYDWAPMQFFLRKEIADKYNIHSLADLAKSKAPLRIGINRSGNITSNLALKMLAEAGLTEKAVQDAGGQFVRAGANEQGDLIQDGRLDMITNGIFINHSSFRSVDAKVPVVLLSVPQNVIDETNKAFGTSSMVIPAHSYKHQDKDIKSVTLSAILVTSDKMSDETGYQLAKALLKNIDEIRGVHKSMRALTPELLTRKSLLPYQPGAERAYREAGLIK